MWISKKQYNSLRVDKVKAEDELERITNGIRKTTKDSISHCGNVWIIGVDALNTITSRTLELESQLKEMEIERDRYKVKYEAVLKTQ